MQKYKLKRTVAMLFALCTLSGCGKKSDCEVPSNHVHLYKKKTPYGVITMWKDCEFMDYWGNEWTPEYIETTNSDYPPLNTLSGYFDGVKNWDYLFKYMASRGDYLEFYYEWVTYEERTRTDEDGNTETYIEVEHHSDWHDDPYDSDNTGYTRLCHYKFRGSRLVMENGRWKIENSGYVDDIRDVINDYPYYTENPEIIVHKYYNFYRWQLPHLNVRDFYGEYGHPDLSNKELNVKPVIEQGRSLLLKSNKTLL